MLGSQCPFVAPNLILSHGPSYLGPQGTWFAGRSYGLTNRGGCFGSVATIKLQFHDESPESVQFSARAFIKGYNVHGSSARLFPPWERGCPEEIIATSDAPTLQTGLPLQFTTRPLVLALLVLTCCQQCTVNTTGRRSPGQWDDGTTGQQANNDNDCTRGAHDDDKHNELNAHRATS